MRYMRLLILVLVLFALSGCAVVVYQHRDMSGEQSTWGKSQIYRMWDNGWFKTNISNRDRWERMPDVNHQSKEIVFLSNGRIYIMDNNGDNVIEIPNGLSDTYAPRWSRGGMNFILFSHPASFPQSAIYRIDPEGNELIQITNPSSTQNDYIAESIDDKHIVFTRFDSANNHGLELYVKYIWDDRPEVRLTTTPNVYENWPVVSHDGRMLAYSVFSGNDHEVHVAIFDHPTEITVVHTIELQLPADKNISGISFSGNDEELFISIESNDVAGNLINRKQELFRVRLDGSNQQRLTNNSDEDVYPCVIP